jgi:Zn-dependent membrane protease YugP
MFFDPLYFLFIAPAFLLSMWAQWRIKATFSQASQVPTPMSGAQAAREVLDSAGLHNVAIEPIAGHLSDHYDPRGKVLRLSEPVYGAHNMAAVGVAAHEAGHALQDAQRYAPLVIRNMAVGLANFGGGISWTMIIIGAMLSGSSPRGFGLGDLLVWGGIAAFSGLVFFQLINLPVEFDASNRAVAQLVERGIVAHDDRRWVRKVLNAAAWTYVAATLQSVMTLLYFVFRFGGLGRSRE